MKHFLKHKGNYILVRSLFVLFLSVSFGFQALHAQDIAISGTVTDETGQPLPSVNIVVQDTQIGTATDINGAYSLNVPSDAVLVVSFLGFKTQLVPVDGRRIINVVLLEDVELLEDVIVIGYGTIKKSHLTGSVSRVQNENLDAIPLSRVDDALVGQIAGVNIQQTNPAAGEAPDITVRGQGSISFESYPLVVLDGIVVGNDGDFLSSLDMNDIESVELLKDASSSAIYGSRGANGILMITTKRGAEGPTQFSYHGYVGFKSVPSTDVLTTPDAWAEFVRANNGGELTDKMTYIQQLGTYTNWEEVMMDGGSILSHSFSAKGGTRNTRYLASINYQNDEGVLLTDNYEKLNFRVNLNTRLRDKLRLSVTLNPSQTEQRRFPIGVHDAIRQNPWLPLYLDENSIQYVNRFRENGRWADAEIGDYAMERMFDDFNLDTGLPNPTNSGTDISGTSNQNALAKVLERDERKFENKVYANTQLTYQFSDNFEFKQRIGGDYRNTLYQDWAGIEASRNGAADSESIRRSRIQTHVVTESVFNYNLQDDVNDIAVVAGFAYESWEREWTRLEEVGYESDIIRTIPGNNIADAYTLKADENLISYFSRVNYAFKNKYLISISARTDGSSKFGPDKKFGFFPAGSIGWNITDEDFMQDQNIVQDFKIRISYGQTGSNNFVFLNSDIPEEYAHIGLLDPVATGFGGVGVNQQNIANPDFGWEKLVEINPGFDVAFLDRKINLSFDYYKRTSRELIIDLPIPSATGFTNALVNRGEVENEGIELELLTRNYLSKDASWTTTATVTHNKNTLTNFESSNGLISTVDDKRPAEWIALEGNPIASFYGFVVDREIGLEFINDPFSPINAQSQDIYVRDLNGDGVIDGDDRTILGSPYPDFIWSLTNNIKYKNFELSFMFQGAHGAEVRNISGQYINNEFSGRQDYNSDFTDADLVQQRIFTSDDIQDASYVALRNLNLAYNLPNSFLIKAGVQSARLYFSGQNLIYIMADDYIGYNPEGVDSGASKLPTTYGYQRGTAPIYRSVSFGINLDF